MSELHTEELGPLRFLVGTWEGDKGKDVAPSDDPSNDRGTAESDFRERIAFVLTGAVDNHEQRLFGLHYSKTAWRISTGAEFHQECGYWLWDKARSEVLIAFTVPRGISVLAGGSATADDGAFSVSANVGSETFGIASGPFLDEEFKTTRFDMDVQTLDMDKWSYKADTHILLKGKENVFHHTDENTLTRV